MSTAIIAKEKTYGNKQLQKATDTVKKLERGIQSSLFETAAIIAKVESEKLYLDDGFRNVHEWTKEAFNIEKSASYNMLKIGKNYTRPVLNEKGKTIGYRSTLTDENTVDYNVTQITRMLPVPPEELPEAIEKENITPALTVKEIESKIKHYLKDDETEAETEETETVEDNETQDDDAHFWVTISITTAEQIIEVLKAYGTDEALELVDEIREQI